MDSQARIGEIIILLWLCSVPVSALGLPAQSSDLKCEACHSEELMLDKHGGIKAQILEKCVSCHADLPGHASDEVTSDQPANPDDLAIKLPMYYDKSRIGDKPNSMVRVPGGKFTMGTNLRLPDEGPEHIENIGTFWIDKYEVTNLQYKRFIDATGHRSPNHFENRTFPPGKADHPVTFVSWFDANAYCKWAGKRLPTDKEWEKAARGTDARLFPWGNTFNPAFSNSPQRWMALGKDGDTTPVGAFEQGKSPYGAYDMSGNVWEWTASWYKAYPGNQHPTENYGEEYKTLKGGSWWDCSFYQCGISAPVYNRAFFLRGTKNKSFGFRCAKDEE